MKKENRQPNFPETRVKKYSNKTPESTSKGPFKPRFIHKVSTIHEPESFSIKSPTCLDTRSNSVRRNWKEEYENSQTELNRRTKKFDEVIFLCTNILEGIYSCSRADEQDSEMRLAYIKEKTGELLETFQMFQQTNHL